MKSDPKELVENGYDRIALRYLKWSTLSPAGARIEYLHKVLERLPPEAKVLELGCGAGMPCTLLLTQHAAHVTGIDISRAQIALASQNVPSADLFQADMMALMFASSTFDAILAFYSLIHLPREEQRVLVRRLADWLRPGGCLLANLGVSDNPGFIDPNWLGMPMYWSGYDANTNREMISSAGLTEIEAEIRWDDEDGNAVPFLWVLATKLPVQSQ
jgi:SAM-dependent methyltransferase